MDLCRPHPVDHAHNTCSNASFSPAVFLNALPSFSLAARNSLSSWPEFISCACRLPCLPWHLSARISALAAALQVTQGNNLQFAALLALNALILFATFLALGVVLSIVGSVNVMAAKIFALVLSRSGKSFSLAFQRQPLEFALRLLCRTEKVLISPQTDRASGLYPRALAMLKEAPQGTRSVPQGISHI